MATTLPTVEFARSGPVAADQAAYVTPAENGDGFHVQVRYANGGCLGLAYNVELAVADGLAGQVNELVGSWVRHAIEAGR